MNKRQRNKNRATSLALISAVRKSVMRLCCNCKEMTDHGHFVPPCFGKAGYFFCQEKQ